MSQPPNHLIVGNRIVEIGPDRGSAVFAADEPPPPPRRPRAPQLPPPGDEPVGRAHERAAVKLMISPGEPVQIHGPRGIGKSTLLRAVAHDLAAESPAPREEVIYLYGAGRELDDVLQDLFEALYDAPAQAPSRARMRRLLGDVSATLLVDDLECPVDQFREFLDAAPGIALVFTATGRQAPVEQAVELGGLDQEAAFELLARELGRSLLSEETPGAAALWRATGGRPLDLIRAAALIASHADGTAASGGSFGRPGLADGSASVLYERLGEDHRAVLALLVTFPAEHASAALIAGAVGQASAARQACDDLVRAGHLVADRLPGGDVRHRLAPGAERLPRAAVLPAAAVADLAARLTAWAGSPTTSPSAVSANAGLLAAIVTATAETRPDAAVALARAAAPAAARSLRWGGWHRLLRAGLAAAEKAGDTRAAAYFQHERGVSLLVRAAPGAAAALAAAALLWKQAGDTAGAAITMHAQGALVAPPSAASTGPIASPAPAPDATGAAVTSSTATSPTITSGVTIAKTAAIKTVVVKTALVTAGLGLAGTGVYYSAPPVLDAIADRTGSSQRDRASRDGQPGGGQDAAVTPEPGACLRVTPGSLDFGTVIGTARRELTIENVCPSALDSVTLAVSDARFQAESSPCALESLPARRPCELSIVFRPDGSGTASATLDVTGAGGTVAVPLTGKGGVPVLAGTFRATGFDMTCTGTRIDPATCEYSAKYIRRSLSLLPPFRLKPDPACSAPPCGYDVAGYPAATGHGITPDPGGSGYLVSGPLLEAVIAQISGAYGVQSPDVSAVDVRLTPAATDDGPAVGFDLKGAIPYGGDLFAFTLTFKRAAS